MLFKKHLPKDKNFVQTVFLHFDQWQLILIESCFSLGVCVK